MEKSCQNCQNFRVHYVKSIVRFVPTNCGHCIKKKRAKESCNFWEAMVEKDSKRIVKDALLDMADKVQEFAMFFASDKK